MTHIRRYIIALLFLFADHAFGQVSSSRPGFISYSNPVITKAHTSQPIANRLRVVMMTDFPPIGVVKAGNVPNDQKSDPDDMQSIVRFLLYANEFDIEGIVVSSGTFANTAKKINMLPTRYPRANQLNSLT